jgi:phage terminase Nu1 subunit (DNA packaging protein)
LSRFRAQVPKNGMGRTPTNEDRQLAVSAAGKKRAGQTLTRPEERALRRVQAFQDEQDRWRHYAAIPKGHYCKLSARQQKVVDEQARRYGLPVLGEQIDLAAVLVRFHDLLRDHGDKIVSGDEEDELLQGPNSPALERWRNERAKIARMERLELQGQLLPREVVRRSLQIIAQQISSLGEKLHRDFGPTAQKSVFTTVDSIERELRKLLADDRHADETAETSPPDPPSVGGGAA